jgi:hypothetical protein
VRKVFEEGRKERKKEGKKRGKTTFIGFPGLLSCSHYHVQILTQTPTLARQKKKKGEPQLSVDPDKHRQIYNSAVPYNFFFLLSSFFSFFLPFSLTELFEGNSIQLFDS